MCLDCLDSLIPHLVSCYWPLAQSVLAQDMKAPKRAQEDRSPTKDVFQGLLKLHMVATPLQSLCRIVPIWTAGEPILIQRFLQANVTPSTFRTSLLPGKQWQAKPVFGASKTLANVFQNNPSVGTYQIYHNVPCKVPPCLKQRRQHFSRSIILILFFSAKTKLHNLVPLFF